MDGGTAVVAIGGNSLIKDKYHQTVRDQYIAAARPATRSSTWSRMAGAS